MLSDREKALVASALAKLPPPRVGVAARGGARQRKAGVAGPSAVSAKRRVLDDSYAALRAFGKPCWSQWVEFAAADGDSAEAERRLLRCWKAIRVIDLSDNETLVMLRLLVAMELTFKNLGVREFQRKGKAGNLGWRKMCVRYFGRRHGVRHIALGVIAGNADHSASVYACRKVRERVCFHATVGESHWELDDFNRLSKKFYNFPK